MTGQMKTSFETNGEAVGGNGSPSSFNASVASLLERVEYRRCETGEDLETIYRLRHDSYVAGGMLEAKPSRAVIDEYDDLPNAYRFGVYIDGQLVSTIRLHYVTAQHPHSPSMTVFGDELQPRLDAGETFIDPSRFAADMEAAKQFRVLPYITLRLAVVACGYFDPTFCLTAVKEEHANFYRRIFNATAALPPRIYPGLIVPVTLFQSRTSENMANTVRRFPFFGSTESERRMLFDRPGIGEVAPLTVLPTAKYYREAA